jgi:hypothetical protein
MNRAPWLGLAMLAVALLVGWAVFTLIRHTGQTDFGCCPWCR